MKLHRIQIIYLLIAAALLLGFTTAGRTGFRVFSVFTVSSWVHTGGPGVHHK